MCLYRELHLHMFCLEKKHHVAQCVVVFGQYNKRSGSPGDGAAYWAARGEKRCDGGGKRSSGEKTRKGRKRRRNETMEERRGSKSWDKIRGGPDHERDPGKREDLGVNILNVNDTYMYHSLINVYHSSDSSYRTWIRWNKQDHVKKEELWNKKTFQIYITENR